MSTEEEKAARRAERRAMREKRREARLLKKTRARAVRIGRKLDPRLPEDLVEIEGLAAAASMETKELIAASDYVDNGGKIDWIERLWEIFKVLLQNIELDEDTINDVADAVNKAVDIPSVPEWMETMAFRAIARAVWKAIDGALDLA